MLDALNTRPLLTARQVTKTFGATQALKAFDFALMPGSIHALIGENGAGKSTFIKILAGLYQPDGGELYIDGASADQPSIAFIHQDLGLIPGMSAAENVILGSDYPRRFGAIDWKAVVAMARESLAVIGAEFDPELPIEQLAIADRALVAIARAVRLNAKVLVLDEPTATLPGSDVSKLFAVLKRLQAQGMGMIYVSHRLREILDIADTVTVVRDGALSFSGPVDGLNEAKLVEHMIGSEAVEHGRATSRAFSGPAMLTVRGLHCQGIAGLDLTVGRGEIVGCVGLRGAGQEMLGRALAAVIPFSGDVTLDGSAYRPRRIDAAIKAGIAFVTGDRDAAIVRNLTLKENLFIHPPRTSISSWVRSPAKESAHIGRTIANYDIRPRQADKLIGELSGGNAQKLVFARGFESSPKLVILDDPTAGVDMPTRYALYDLMRREAAKGVSFIVTSSDHDEVAAVCDRVEIFKTGRITHTLTEQPFDPEQIVALAQEEAA